MKHMLLFLVIAFNTTCATSNMPVKATNLEEMIRNGEDLYFENQTFEEDIDFTKILKPNMISEGIYQVRIVSSVTFKNCTFNGKVVTYNRDENRTILSAFQSNLTFIGCTFNEDASFRASSVMGRTDFTGSTFIKTSNFEECTFFQNVYFRKAVFHEELRFQNAFFMQKVNFLNAEFDENASFQGSTFNSEAQFSTTKFAGYADFTLINWNQNCFFDFAEFMDRAVFNSSDFKNRVDFVSVQFNYCEIMNCRFLGEIRFTESSVSKKIIFDNSKFLYALPDLGLFEAEKLSKEGIGKF